MPAAWGVSLGAPETVIAVLDTGVDAVPQVTSKARPRREGHLRGGDGDTSDPEGHGTVVAEVAAARIDNGVGAAGICPRCSILPVTHRLDARGLARASDIRDGHRVGRGSRGVRREHQLRGDRRVGCPHRRPPGRRVRAVGRGERRRRRRNDPGTDAANTRPLLPGVISVAWRTRRRPTPWTPTRPGSGPGWTSPRPVWRPPPVDASRGSRAAAPPSRPRWSPGPSRSSPRPPRRRRWPSAIGRALDGRAGGPAGAIGGGRLDVPGALGALGAKVPPSQPVVGARRRHHQPVEGRDVQPLGDVDGRVDGDAAPGGPSSPAP